MASENEPAKLLLPYLQRADELQKHEPLVAYYCRLYAMERGLKIPQSERTKTTNSLLISLMNQLEKDKKSLKLGPDDHLHLEGFAMNVFAKADKQDRVGRADINTAKTFYAASIFFEILNQFGELAPDLEQKQKYAVWKAADIRKALKEGRKPVPGPPGGEDDFLASPTTQGAHDFEPSKPAEDINPGLEPDPSPSTRYEDEMKRQSSVKFPPAPPSYPSDYPTHEYHAPHVTGRSENPTYSQQYHQPSYPQEHQPSYQQEHQPSYQQEHQPSYQQEHQPSYPQEHLPSYPQDSLPQKHVPHNNYPSHENPPSYSYTNFQSYPSFSESTLPAAPPNYSSYYQGSDASYSHQPAPSATTYPSVPQYNSSSGNGTVAEPAPASPQTYQYDNNYQPPPEKIAEAHKAARFAVGALAFDDVSVAVDYLRKSLELLTNPSAGE